MLILTCPFCGPRDEVEFRYRGDASVARPTADAGTEAFADYVYQRENPAGLHAEWWLHAAGCGLAFRITRDTVSHAIHGGSASP
jgi:methylglutamate dehydrogenase subunit B